MSVPNAPYVFKPESTNQTLEFAWNTPYDGGSPITNYRLQLNGGAYFYTTGNYYLVSGLTNGTTYYTTIEAENEFGWGPPASFTPFEPGSSRPNPPSTATVSVVGAGSALVSWTPPSVLPDAPIQWYPIYSQSTNPADPVISVTGDAWSQSNYVISGLNSNSQYNFSVYAVNCPGWSAPTITNNIRFYQNGLYFSIYSGYFNDDVNWFTGRASTNAGVASTFTNINTGTAGIIPVNGGDNYSVQWLGFFKPIVSGSHTFYTVSDDASYVWIGSNALSGFTTANALVNNGGAHAPQERSGTISLTAGEYYNMRVQFGEATGGDDISISVLPPSGTRIYNLGGYVYYL
jgi:hypothetical protein